MRERFAQIDATEVEDDDLPYEIKFGKTHDEVEKEGQEIDVEGMESIFVDGKKFSAISEDRLESKLDTRAKEVFEKSDYDHPDDDSYVGYEVIFKDTRALGGKYYTTRGFVVTPPM